MLDDPTYIARFDRSEGFAMVASQPEQLRHQYQFEAPQADHVTNIVLAGMGGSALAAEFIRSWLNDKLTVPFEIVRDYNLPAYVGKGSLVIISSYSGNTEETLSCLNKVGETGATVVRMSAGGKLGEAGEVHSYLEIPTGLQPRFAVLYEAKAIAVLLEQLGFVTDSVVDELETAAEWLLDEITHFAPNIPEADNVAKQIAKQVVGHPVVVYGGPTLAMPAMKWKIDFNENAKNLAFWNQLPEFNHNEFLGWGNPKNSLMKVVQLQSSLDNNRIARRFEITNKLLSGSMPAPIIVTAHGQTKLQQMLWTMLLGDFVATYTAMLNQVDPVPVELIEKLKKELAD